VPEQFGDIQSALDVAGPCDVVEVGTGDYEGAVTVGIGVTLRAVGDASIDGGGFDENGGQIDAVVSVTNGSRVEGFDLHNARAGVEIGGNWSVVRGNTIHDVDYGIALEGSTGYAVDNVVLPGVSKGVRANGSTLWLDGNTFTGTGTGVDLFQTVFRMVGNTVSESGRGYVISQSYGEVTSCTLTGNDLGLVISGGDVVVQDCTIQDSLVGAQVLDGQPLLLDNTFENNDFGITMLLSSPRVIGNRVVGSTYTGIVADLASTPRIANNLLIDNSIGLDAVLSSPVVVNNTFSGGERSALFRSADPTFVNNLLIGASVVAMDATAAPDLLAGFNLFFDNVLDLDGWTSALTDVFEDPLLDENFVPSAASPAIDRGNTALQYEDPDGTISDIGSTGGPEALDRYVPLPGGPPTLGKQAEVELAEGEQGVLFVQNIVDPRNDPIELRWDTNPDDGLQYCDGYANAVDFTPPDQGTYTVWVRAEDNEGFQVEAEVTIIAFNLDPTVSLDLLSGFQEGMESQFYVDAFDPGPEDVVLLDIDTDGDGEYERTGVEPGFVALTPPQSGQITLRVRAYDGDGGEHVVQQPLFVENLPPFLTETPPDEIFVGSTFSYTLQVDDPSELDTVTAALSNGPDGLTLDGLRLLWEPTAADVGQNPYDITLTDSDGAAVVFFLRIGVFREDTGCQCSAGAGPGPGAGMGLMLVLAAGGLRRRRT
jgi:MYXO-CTERM domain-containing protein